MHSFKQTLEILFQILRVLLCRLAIDARCRPLAGATKGLFQPVKVDQVVQRRKTHLRRLFGYFRYPSPFR